MSKALLVIDVQNDYFPNGKFPLWDTDATLDRIEHAIRKAQTLGMHVIHIQHIAKGASAFFNAGEVGAEIHPRMLQAAPHAHVVIKSHADSFEQTRLQNTLDELEVDELWICGMMTQNCVTHTAISKSAEKYPVNVLADCCTTVSEILHKIALNALSTRVKLVNSEQAFYTKSPT